MIKGSATLAKSRSYKANPLSMEQERELALALDRADAALAAELAELKTQARIVAIERREREFGLHDPTEHRVEHAAAVDQMDEKVTNSARLSFEFCVFVFCLLESLGSHASS
jgi:hypothetical protein